MPDEPVPQEFVDELEAAFRRLEARGSHRWGSSSNLGRLQRVLERGIELVAPSADEQAPAHPSTGSSPRARLHDVVEVGTDRWARWFGTRQVRTVARQVVERATGSALSALEEALGAVSGTLQFLTARVEVLEEAAARRHRPVDGLAWLVAPPDLDAWEGTVAAWLADAAGADGAGPGDVVVGECGTGALAATLVTAGWRVTGAEPRAQVALQAARAGVDVKVAEVAEVVATAGRGSLAAVVLAGVVDRAPVDELLALVATSVERLRPGGVLVVVCGGTAGWDVPALDLLPGRPLHPETWELLLRRLDLSGVESVEAPRGATEGWAVTGRR
jgi:hypothetical protein